LLAGKSRGPLLASALTGLHFLLSLCLYDGALTLVEVNHAALLSEIRPVTSCSDGEGEELYLGSMKEEGNFASESKHAESVSRQRVRANAWVAGAMALGAITSLPAQTAWEADCTAGMLAGQATSGYGSGNLRWWWSWWPGYFRSFALLLGVLCAVLFWVASVGILFYGGGSGNGVMWDATSLNTPSSFIFSPKSIFSRSTRRSSSVSGKSGGKASFVATPGLRHRLYQAPSTFEKLLEDKDSCKAQTVKAGARAFFLEGGEEINVGDLGHGISTCASAMEAGSREQLVGTESSSGFPHLIFSDSGKSEESAEEVLCAEDLCSGMGPLENGEHYKELRRSSSLASSSSPYVSFISTLSSLPSVQAYVTLASLQSFDCSFGKSFYSLFLASLWVHAFKFNGLEESRTTPAGEQGLASVLFSVKNPQALLIFASFLLPHAITLLLEPCVNSRGVGVVLRGIAVFRLYISLFTGCVAVGVYFCCTHSSAPLPPRTTHFLALFPILVILTQLFSRVSSESVCRIMPLLKASMVDEWRATESREKKVGEGVDSINGSMEKDRPAALIGAADCLPRAFSSLAPILGYLLVYYCANEDSTENGLGGTYSLITVTLTLSVLPAIISGFQVRLLDGITLSSSI